MKQTEYFTEKEFYCKCGKCEPKLPPDELIDALVEIREHYDSPLIINSAYRCKEHNAKIGGAAKSRHIEGDAVDFVIKGQKTLDVYNWIIEHFGDKPWGIAKRIQQDPYRGFVHLDTRGTKARWNYPGSIA